ncbi:ligand-gated channel protein, partial [Pseudoalteromonas ruthenica]
SELLGQAFQDLTGQTGAFAPDYSGNIAIDYNTEVFSNLTLSSNLALNFSDDYFLEQDLDPIAKQSAFEKLNLRVELGSNEGNWSVSLLAK